MSRIGRLPIEIPAGVTAKVEDGNVVTVKGPLGELSQKFKAKMYISEENVHLVIKRPNDVKEMRALHGLTRAMLHNMVEGVSKGFAKELEIVGVGYRVQLAGSKLTFNLGYSHTIDVEPPAGIKFESPSNTSVIVKGIDRQLVGQVAANIRELRPPEPYKGKGIRYKGETVRHKEGKTGM